MLEAFGKGASEEMQSCKGVINAQVRAPELQALIRLWESCCSSACVCGTGTRKDRRISPQASRMAADGLVLRPHAHKHVTSLPLHAA